MLPGSPLILKFEEISLEDLPQVGGKNASLGEMIRALSPLGVRIPPGFALTTQAYDETLGRHGLGEWIRTRLDGLDSRNVAALEATGREIRDRIRRQGLPESVARELGAAYRELCAKAGIDELDVAVRSSATAEDLPEASFAGLQETFLNVRGERELLESCLACIASLFTDRAISYRAGRGFDHDRVKLSVGVQRMVRSDLGSSGVVFTLDTETGARNVILITSAWGLGENIVAGRVDPDEFIVSKSLLFKARLPILRRRLGEKQLRLVYESHGTRRTRNVEVSRADRETFSLPDGDILQLARWSFEIERHYSMLRKAECPMDIEWGRDGRTGELFVLQARPETVHSVRTPEEQTVMSLDRRGEILLRGRAVGSRIGSGRVRVLSGPEELQAFQSGEVLVTDMTDPDWEPVMRKAAAIVTNRGGRTCHAAIVSREHGVPCLVGTGVATQRLQTGEEVTVSCAEGDEGHVYRGILPFTTHRLDWDGARKTRTKLLVNLGNPDIALKTSLLPVDGVGLARIEFIIAEHVGIHPMALAHLERIPHDSVRNRILAKIRGHEADPGRYFADRLAEGIGMIAGAFYPRPVLVRLSDFKTNEYAGLLGGDVFEPKEENPMLGFRGACRYHDPRYRDGFALECRAIRKVRDDMALTNVKLLVPFCRTPEEAERVLEELSRNGLVRGEKKLEVLLMVEVPSNVLQAERFAELFDGFSIGSNDLTQLVLGADRDSEILGGLFDERDPSVMGLIGAAIQAARRSVRPIGICGQAPSDFPEFAKFLLDQGIDSISLNPDAVPRVRRLVLEHEARASKGAVRRRAS